MKYTTADYLRDSYPAIDFFGDIFLKFLRQLKTVKYQMLLKLKRADFENILENIWHNLPYGIIILYLGFLFISFLFIESEKNSGIDVYTITTSSMSPEITPGSTIITRKVSDYNVGDIISYRQADVESGVTFSRSLTHRIIEKRVDNEKLNYVTKGDANDLPDPYIVGNNQINGKTILIIPLLGYLFFFVKTIPGFLVLVGLPVFLIIKNEVSYIMNEVRVER